MPEFKVVISKKDGSLLPDGSGSYVSNSFTGDEQKAIDAAYSSFVDLHEVERQETVHKIYQVKQLNK